MNRISMVKEEKKWKREGDARTLAEAAAIKADPKRYAEAKKGASEMAPEMEKESKATLARARAMKRLGKSKK